MTLTVTEQHRAAVPATTPLRVDRDDPFFFDHPLDHVPGMLLVAGLLDVVRAAGGGGTDANRVALSLTFATLCELDEATALCATPHAVAPDGQVRAWSVRAVQSGRDVCTGLVSGYRVDPTEITPVPAGAPVLPADRRLVHRARPENVLIGAPERIAGEYRFPVLPPAAGTFLSRRGRGGYCVETLIESGRQMSTMLAHTDAGHPLGTQLLWSTVDADLPWSLPAGAAPALLCRPDRAKGRRMRYRATLVGAGAGEFHGALGYTCAAVSAASFHRFRAAAGRAA
jgi:A-factor biosynthesis hotdog domain